ncbi:MAG TPA: protein TolR [Alphaproteobacteria bacterium]|nr:protein TolR [Alphaproteobacteria bacterium]
MAFSPNTPSNARGRRRSTRLVSEINVTPMVDVMLVLLVVFMITAPLLTVGVPVDLPKSKASAMNEKEEPLTITVDAKGNIYLQETALDLGVLVPRLVAITGSNPEARIYVRGDKGVFYGRVMEVMGAINEAGFTKVALISELPSGGAPIAPPNGLRK